MLDAYSSITFCLLPHYAILQLSPPCILHFLLSCLRCSFWPPCFLQLYHRVFRLCTLRYVYTYPYTITPTWRRHAGLEGGADTQLPGQKGVVRPRPRCAGDRIQRHCSFCGKGQERLVQHLNPALRKRPDPLKVSPRDVAAPITLN